MPTVIKKTLLSWYYQHGLISFLLFFVPFIPGLIESHTRTYLSLLKKLNHDLKDVEEGIGIVFGSRGLLAYQEYKKAHPEHIRPGDIFRTLYQQTDFDLTLTKIEALFSNPPQRQHLLSDLYRSTIYAEIPYILHAFPQPEHEPFRNRLVSLFSDALAKESSPEAQKAGLQTCQELLHRHYRYRRTKSQQQHDNLYLSTSLMLTATLSKPASIYSAPLKLPTKKTLPRPFASHCVSALHQSLEKISAQIAPENLILLQKAKAISIH